MKHTITAIFSLFVITQLSTAMETVSDRLSIQYILNQTANKRHSPRLQNIIGNINANVAINKKTVIQWQDVTHNQAELSKDIEDAGCVDCYSAMISKLTKMTLYTAESISYLPGTESVTGYIANYLENYRKFFDTNPYPNQLFTQECDRYVKTMKFAQRAPEDKRSIDEKRAHKKNSLLFGGSLIWFLTNAIHTFDEKYDQKKMQLLFEATKIMSTFLANDLSHASFISKCEQKNVSCAKLYDDTHDCEKMQNSFIADSTGTIYYHSRTNENGASYNIPCKALFHAIHESLIDTIGTIHYTGEQKGTKIKPVDRSAKILYDNIEKICPHIQSINLYKTINIIHTPDLIDAHNGTSPQGTKRKIDEN